MSTAPKLLLASDFDGTLAAIREQPETVAIDPEALRFLRGVAARQDLAVALISGRDVDDLRGRAGDLPAWYSGSHGREIVAPDGATIQSAESWKGSPPREWIERATAAGLRLEPKKFGVALHWRGVPGVDAAHPLIAAFERWAEGAGLAIIHGRCVAEAATGGSSKESVLRFLLDRTGASTLIYAGDDLTDFPALAFAAAHGRGLLVASAERPEPPPQGVESVRSREELLRRFGEIVADLAPAPR